MRNFKIALWLFATIAWGYNTYLILSGEQVHWSIVACGFFVVTLDCLNAALKHMIGDANA